MRLMIGSTVRTYSTDYGVVVKRYTVKYDKEPPTPYVDIKVSDGRMLHCPEQCIAEVLSEPSWFNGKIPK